MARKIARTTKSSQIKIEDLKPYLSLAIQYSPIWFPILLIVLLGAILVFPAYKKQAQLTDTIEEKSNFITTVQRSKFDVDKTKRELEQFKLKVEEFDKRLPRRLQTNLIIETLQEVTKQADLKFSSLKPVKAKKYELKETNDVFVELPIDVKLRCSYYELVDFLKKIETAKQLMKISDLAIRDDPTNDWMHMVEFSVSAFSKGGENE